MYLCAAKSEKYLLNTLHSTDIEGTHALTSWNWNKSSILINKSFEKSKYGYSVCNEDTSAFFPFKLHLEAQRLEFGYMMQRYTKLIIKPQASYTSDNGPHISTLLFTQNHSTTKCREQLSVCENMSIFYCLITLRLANNLRVRQKKMEIRHRCVLFFWLE